MATRAATLRMPGRRRAATAPRLGLGGVALACLVLAGLSLLGPATPTYDPYAWLIWGREVLHLQLDTQFGPSWKPLPVALTTVFAIIPGAAPALWLAVARAGGIGALVLAFRVARRLGGGVAGGLVAALSLALVSNFMRFAAVGDSEGLLVALLLLAIELHLCGRERGALWAGFGAALLRPESWLFVGLYALWLARREPGVRKLVAGLALATLALWFGPEMWGSGNPWRGGQRAREPNPNALAFADHPAWEIAKRAVAMTPAVALAGMLAALAQRKLRLLVLAALAWLAEVAVMTEVGFSGNARYLIAPIGLACVAAGAALGRLSSALPARAAIALALLVVAPFVALRADNLRTDGVSVDNEAHLMSDLSAVLRASGGSARVRRCGTPVTGPFQVTALAWRLHVPIDRLSLAPSSPGTVFRRTPNGPAVPKAPPIHVADPSFQPVAQVGVWQTLSTCR